VHRCEAPFGFWMRRGQELRVQMATTRPRRLTNRKDAAARALELRNDANLREDRRSDPRRIRRGVSPATPRTNSERLTRAESLRVSI
jgi:hypothetical protein